MERLVSCLIIFILVSTAFGGSPLITHVSGTPTNSPNSGVSDDTGSGVDPASGRFTQQFPLLHIPGRCGLDVDVTLRYDSEIWQADPYSSYNQINDNTNVIGISDPLKFNGDKTWLNDFSPFGLGFDLSFGRIRGEKHHNTINGNWYWYRFYFEDPNGGKITFVSDNPNYADTGRDDQFIGLDPSGVTLLVEWGDSDNNCPTSLRVVYQDGIQYEFQTGSGLFETKSTPSNEVQWSGQWGCTSIKDLAGNHIDISYHPHPQHAGWFVDIPTRIVDTYNHVITFNSEPSSDGEMIGGYPSYRLTGIQTYASATGSSYSITFNYGDNPYTIIGDNGRGGPFDDTLDHTLKRVITTNQGSDSENRIRVILDSIVITPQNSGVRTVSFGYNGVYELTSITLPFGARQDIHYMSTSIASCCIPNPETHGGDNSANPYINPPLANGTQEIRVVDSLSIGTGDSPLVTQYHYLVYPNIDEEDQPRTPQYMCFSKTIAYQPSTHKRVEYEYYSDTPVRVYYQDPDGHGRYCYYREITTNKPALAGLKKSMTIYYDPYYNDDEFRVMKRQERTFYCSVLPQFLHLAYSSGVPINTPGGPLAVYYGNIWEFFYPAATTVWQDGQTTMTAQSVIANYNWGEMTYFEHFYGFHISYELSGSDIERPYDDGEQLDAELLDISAHNLEITSFSYRPFDPSSRPSDLDYTAQGIWNLVEKIQKDEAPGAHEIEVYSSQVADYNPIITSTENLSYDNSLDNRYVYLTSSIWRQDIDSSHHYFGRVVQDVLKNGSGNPEDDVIGRTDYQYYSNGQPFGICKWVQKGTLSAEDLFDYCYFDYETNVQGNNLGRLRNQVEYISIANQPDFYAPHQTTYTSNALGQVTSIQDANNGNGNTETFTYDDYGRLLSHTVNDHLVQETSYHDSYPISSTTNTYDGTDASITTLTYYDGLNRPTSCYEKTSYDSDWKTMTTTTYDSAGRVTSETLPTPINQNIPGRKITYNSYDVLGRATQTTDPNGLVITTETHAIQPGEPGYDWMSNLGIRTYTGISDSGGACKSISYDAQGHVIWTAERIQNNPMGPVCANTFYYYDEGGRLWKQISPEGLITYYYYDAVSRLVAIDTPDETANFPIDHGIRYQYPNVPTGTADTLIMKFTLSGQPLEIRTARGYFQFTYDGAGRLLKKEFSIPPNGPWRTIEEHRYGFTANDAERTYGRLIESTYYDLSRQGTTYSVDYSYDESGQVATETFRLGDIPAKTIHFTYDWLGRMTSLQYPEGDMVRYIYQASQLTSITLNDQPLAGAQYDNFRRIATLTFGDTNAYTTYAYNNQDDFLTQFTVTQKALTQGVQLGIGNPSGGSTVSPIDNLIGSGSNIDANSRSQDRSTNDVHHNKGSSVITFPDPLHGVIIDTPVEASQEPLLPLGDLISDSDITGTDLQTIAKDPFTTVKNPDTTVKSPGSTIKNPAGGSAQDSQQNQPLSKFTTLLQERYSYDASGRISDVTDQAGVLQQSYRYDLIGRLISVCLNHVRYDPTTESFRFVHISDGTYYSMIDYTLNKDGTRTSEWVQNAGAHNTPLERYYVYTLDPGTNHLASVSGPNTVFTQEFDSSGSVTNYNGDSITRDCLGQMTSCTHNNVVENYGYMGGMRVRRTTASGTTYSLYLGNDVLAEYDQSGTLLRNNYHGFGQRLATKENNGALSYLVTDPHGNLRCIVPAASQGSVWQGTYTPFGELIGHAPLVGQIGFDGYLRENTGLTYAYARDYDEKHGVFLSMDPMNEGSNPYSYCQGNPLAGRDPTGLMNMHWWQTYLGRCDHELGHGIYEEIINIYESPEHAAWLRELNNQVLSENSWLMEQSVREITAGEISDTCTHTIGYINERIEEAMKEIWSEESLASIGEVYGPYTPEQMHQQEVNQMILAAERILGGIYAGFIGTGMDLLFFIDNPTQENAKSIFIDLLSFTPPGEIHSMYSDFGQFCTHFNNLYPGILPPELLKP